MVAPVFDFLPFSVPVLAIFLCGVANFAMHRAMMESDHPLMAEVRGSFGRFLGRHGSYIIEFVMLAGAMIFANIGIFSAALFYGVYTVANGCGAWFLFTNRR